MQKQRDKRKATSHNDSRFSPMHCLKALRKKLGSKADEIGSLDENIPDLPEYYNELKSELNEPERMKWNMTYMAKPMKRALLDDVKLKMSNMIANTFMEFAGDRVTKNSQTSDYKTMDNLIYDIISKNELSAKSELILYAMKQLNGCPQEFFAKYIEILTIVVTYVKIFGKVILKFSLDFIDDKRVTDLYKDRQREMNYIRKCITSTNVHTTIAEGINCSDWAVKHLSGSFFDCDLETQIAYQKKSSIDMEIPWAIFELIGALKATANADINKIMREASDSDEVTHLKLALDRFEEVGLSYSRESVFMYVLMIYVKSSEIVPTAFRVQLLQLDVDSAGDKLEGKVLKIIGKMPELNKKILAFLIYNFKVNFLKNATEQGHKTARRLLSSYLFDLSNLSEHINDAMTKIQKSTTILGIIFDKYDTTGAEDP